MIANYCECGKRTMPAPPPRYWRIGFDDRCNTDGQSHCWATFRRKL